MTLKRLRSRKFRARWEYNKLARPKIDGNGGLRAAHVGFRGSNARGGYGGHRLRSNFADALAPDATSGLGQKLKWRPSHHRSSW